MGLIYTLHQQLPQDSEPEFEGFSEEELEQFEKIKKEFLNGQKKG